MNFDMDIGAGGWGCGCGCSFRRQYTARLLRRSRESVDGKTVQFSKGLMGRC